MYGSVSQPIRALAPMVRAGTLPLRLLAIGLGADLAYSEELIDHKMVKTQRVVDPETGLVSFVLPKSPNRPVFQTCALERDRVVLQVGSADPARAVHVAQLVEKDVAAFDVNMGCPKPFSVHGGMGAALLKTPEVAEDILKALRRNVTSVPITCKIRLLDTDEATVELVQRLEAAGAQAIGVHMRETHNRPREPAQWARLKTVVEAVNVPILANGDVYTRENAKDILEQSGATGCMFARGALRNPSVFLPDSDAELPIYDVLRDYARIAHLVNNNVANTIYYVREIMRYNPASSYKNQKYTELTKTSGPTPKDVLKAFDLQDETLQGVISWEQLKMKRCIPLERRSQHNDLPGAEGDKTSSNPRDTLLIQTAKRETESSECLEGNASPPTKRGRQE